MPSRKLDGEPCPPPTPLAAFTFHSKVWSFSVELSDYKTSSQWLNHRFPAWLLAPPTRPGCLQSTHTHHDHWVENESSWSEHKWWQQECETPGWDVRSTARACQYEVIKYNASYQECSALELEGIAFYPSDTNKLSQGYLLWSTSSMILQSKWECTRLCDSIKRTSILPINGTSQGGFQPI